MHFLIIEGDKMLLEITQQIIEILNKTLTTVDDADLDDKESQAVRDTCNKLMDINQANLDILYPDRKKVPVQYVK